MPALFAQVSVVFFSFFVDMTKEFLLNNSAKPQSSFYEEMIKNQEAQKVLSNILRENILYEGNNFKKVFSIFH